MTKELADGSLVDTNRRLSGKRCVEKRRWEGYVNVKTQRMYSSVLLHKSKSFTVTLLLSSAELRQGKGAGARLCKLSP
jgi:hypothetical protein